MTTPIIIRKGTTKSFLLLAVTLLFSLMVTTTNLVEAVVVNYFEGSANCTGQITYTGTHSVGCFVGMNLTDLLTITVAGSTVETNVTGIQVNCGESNSAGVTFSLYTGGACTTFLRTINFADTQQTPLLCSIRSPFSFSFQCPLTTAPSAVPSMSPVTSKPSQIPSRSPSRTPTFSKPSLSPSRIPTSSRPSRSPSRTPSFSKPSLSPSRIPTSSRPSRSPSRTPTSSRPSAGPSRSPTKSPPSSRPSYSPSISPSVSTPTSRPSPNPSKVPITAGPSPNPSKVPITAGPSPNPSKVPITAGPSSAPTFPTPLPTASLSHTPSNAPVSRCKGDFGMQVNPCKRLVSYCKSSPIPMKWTGVGCKIGRVKVGDGGCQCKGYCGFKCPGSCNSDKQCRWDRKRRVCINRRTGVINGGCSRV